MAIDLRSLRSFVTIASTGSISAAAEMLHIAQPALSIQIKNLEDQLGSSLFSRHARGVKLTATGHRFLLHCVDILKRVDLAYTDIRSATEDPSGTVAVGLPQSIAKFVAVPLVLQTINFYPKIRLQMIEISTGYIADQLLRGLIDIGLTFGQVDEVRIRSTHLLDEELVLVTAASASLMNNKVMPSKKNLDLRELSTIPMILPTGAHSLRRRIEDCLSQEKISLNIIAEVNTVPQLVELAASGIASTILSYASVSDHEKAGRIQTFKLGHPPLSRPIYLCQSGTLPMSIAATKIEHLLSGIINQQIAEGIWLPKKNY